MCAFFARSGEHIFQKLLRAHKHDTILILNDIAQNIPVSRGKVSTLKYSNLVNFENLCTAHLRCGRNVIFIVKTVDK